MAKKPVEYGFKGERLSLRKAIEFIASVVYPNDDKTDARKRVRERIRYWENKRQVVSGRNVKADDFFRWAADQWPELLEVNGLPRSAKTEWVVGSVDAVMSIESVVIPVSVPGSRKDLVDAYVASETERQLLDSEVKKLKAKLEKCEKKLRELIQRNEEIRLKKSEAGKKGKGIKRLSSN